MTDIRRISVTTEITQDFEIDVEDWFLEFQSDWLSYKQDIDHGETVDELREEWIKEIAYDLAAEGSLGDVRFEDDNLEVEIWQR